MWMVIGVVLVALVLIGLALNKGKSKRGTQKQPKGIHQRSGDQSPSMVFESNKSWLSSRWAEAITQRDAGKLKTFPRWFFNEATQSQLDLLAEKGLTNTVGHLTKGQATDVIGLYFPVEEGNAELLKFFKVPTKELNRTTARAAVVDLLANPAKEAAWKQRPADAIQKEFFKFFGLKAPSRLTYLGADELISKHRKTLNDLQLDEWSSYECILDDLSDKENCENYGIKKPSIATVRFAIDALRQSGMTLASLEGDIDIIAKKLIELKPELKRR